MARVSRRHVRRGPFRFNGFIMGVGILCVVAGIVGGGVTLAGQEIHTLTSVWREIILSIFGVVLMAGSLVLKADSPDEPGRTAGGPAEAEADVPASGRVEPSADLDRWYDSLTNGTLSLELDATSPSAVLTLLGAVRGALTEKGFRDQTVTRVRLVLNELLMNVDRHAVDRTARVTVSIQERHLRLVSIQVCDPGPGIDQSVLSEQERRLAAGEREHGLLLAMRLSTTLGVAPPEEGSCVKCEVIEPPLPRSLLFEFPDVPWVRMEYVHPRVYWLGTEPYVDVEYQYGLINRLSDALEYGWRPVLDLYLKHLTGVRYLPYLVIEVAGDEVGTEMAPGALGRLRAVLESYFADRFRERRVLLLAADTTHNNRETVWEWARDWQLDSFDSEAACRARLEQLRAVGAD